MVLRPPRLQRQQRPPGWRGTGSDCRDRKDCCTRCARSTCGGRVRFALCASTDAGAGTSGCRAWCPRRSQCDRCVRTLRPPLPSRTQHSMPLQPLPRPQAPLLPPHQPACALCRAQLCRLRSARRGIRASFAVPAAFASATSAAGAARGSSIWLSTGRRCCCLCCAHKSAHSAAQQDGSIDLCESTHCIEITRVIK